MSYPLVIRLMIAMAPMPDASYCKALSRLAGLLAGIPFARQWHIPAEEVITDWRRPVPPALTEALFWKAVGPMPGTRPRSPSRGCPSRAVDGMLASVADTKRNREFFGTTGTADGSSSFPQLLVVAQTARAGRAMLGDPGPGEGRGVPAQAPGPAPPGPVPRHRRLLRQELPRP
jgi:hypothetical protein